MVVKNVIDIWEQKHIHQITPSAGTRLETVIRKSVKLNLDVNFKVGFWIYQLRWINQMSVLNFRAQLKISIGIPVYLFEQYYLVTRHYLWKNYYPFYDFGLTIILYKYYKWNSKFILILRFIAWIESVNRKLQNCAITFVIYKRVEFIQALKYYSSRVWWWWSNFLRDLFECSLEKAKCHFPAKRTEIL